MYLVIEMTNCFKDYLDQRKSQGRYRKLSTFRQAPESDDALLKECDSKDTPLCKNNFLGRHLNGKLNFFCQNKDVYPGWLGAGGGKYNTQWVNKALTRIKIIIKNFTNMWQGTLSIKQAPSKPIYEPPENMFSTASKRPSILDFSSCHTLNLSHHPKILKAANEAGRVYGVGSKGSRLLSGNHRIFEQLEEDIARDLRTEAALFFPTGYQANISMLGALLNVSTHEHPPIVFFDKLNHASLYQGLLASHTAHTSHSPSYHLIRYPHLDLGASENQLAKHADTKAFKLIVTETLFGTEGDVVDLGHLVDLCRQYQAMLYVDDSHGTGLYGPRGFGLPEGQNMDGVEYVWMGTFSKGLCGSGAFVGCSTLVKEYAVNTAAGFIYSTAPSPMVAGAAQYAWSMIPTLQGERQHLHDVSAYLHRTLRHAGHAVTGTGASHIASILFKDEEAALCAQKHLQEHGISVSCLRPPTVPSGTSRLKITLSVHHTHADIDYFVRCLGV